MAGPPVVRIPTRVSLEKQDPLGDPSIHATEEVESNDNE
jgi:hypothetical protein